jgi:hypothetical protein
MIDQVLEKMATQTKRATTRKVARPPVGWGYAVVIPPMMAMQIVRQTEPTRRTNSSDLTVKQRDPSLTRSATDFVRKIEGSKGRQEKDDVKDEYDSIRVGNTEGNESGECVIGNERDSLSLSINVSIRCQMSTVTTHWRHIRPIATRVLRRFLPWNNDLKLAPS